MFSITDFVWTFDRPILLLGMRPGNLNVMHILRRGALLSPPTALSSFEDEVLASSCLSYDWSTVLWAPKARRPRNNPHQTVRGQWKAGIEFINETTNSRMRLIHEQDYDS